MDVGNWIALGAVVMAFLALVVAAFAYMETKRAADANVSMAESNKTMADSNKSMADSNKSMAESNRSMEESARKSAEIAIQSFERELEQYRDERMARLRVTRAPRPQPEGFLNNLRFDVFNFGQHVAFTVAITVEYAGKAYPLNSVDRIGIREHAVFEWTVDPAIILDETPQTFPIHLRFEDGLGRHITSRNVTAFGTKIELWKIDIVNPEDGR